MSPRASHLAATWLAVTAIGCGGTDATPAPHGSASGAPSGAVSPPPGASPRISDEARKRELRRKLGEEEDEPDAVPSAPGPTPSDASVEVLLGGGAALKTLPVRSTDPGKRFDRYLPARLKPEPAQGPASSRCKATDPLCDE